MSDPSLPRDPNGPNGSRDPADPVRDPWRPAMRHALEEAALAPRTGDVPVGAVVLAPDGTVLGRGRNEREATGDPTAHAEVVAIRAAARAVGEWRLSGCTLAVTLEPCTMCAGAIVLARLERVVYGAVDDKAGAAGSLWDVVRDRRLNHRPEVVSGVLAAECGRLLTDFFRGPGRESPSRPGTRPDTDFGTRPPVG
ncbi:tRNA adenosine(34) deaminase TadA [Streptomyces sp. TRM 70361]|uniref:tRNA adenosine(34) deaminase TadA n=1 Tax=Streptomyces sp. TRM 70361 TaxID=3116553 RepID=UPI002E7B0783|nr:tRNA adenosine(34) deaminase TadA [Streptomyces sp. TRM 70361]MEE1939677.1 tRNA adenosine(34) deaminase TadA [Streptomyces sp. TRM 70361]